ncbi:MAG: 3-deoxy-D-manno-octulosonic acid transferase [Candidatus Omnitrophica bacterium]|nr:3-deoxy-D-manno-octulosonic acid transferase [Candidatus Omnitrophota bacterium]
MYILYDFIFLAFAVLYAPYFFLKGKHHSDIWQRFGFFKQSLNSKLSTLNSPIWLHAVSVGEVAALKSFWTRVRSEFPSKRIVVSTVTKSGNELARKFALGDEQVFYLPLDISFMVNRVLDIVKPGILIIAETEIWPNLISACYKKNIPAILVNGRVSDAAFARYKLAAPFLKAVLRRLSRVLAQTDLDRERFARLGARPDAVSIAGNMKFCNVDAAKKSAAEIKTGLGINDGGPILSAGSTHSGEEGIILDVFARLKAEFKKLHLVIAPRHPERSEEVKRAAGALSGVTVVDKIGALNDIYSVSDIVFVGGSLCQRGGHNIIEPAVFGKATLFGPYMFNFKEVASEFLRARAAIRVNSAAELESNVRRLLNDEAERRRMGERARKLVLENQGAVENCILEMRKALADAGQV